MDDYVPNRKIVSAGIGGTVATVIISGIQYYFGVTVTAELAAAIATIVSVIIGYLVPNKQDNV